MCGLDKLSAYINCFKLQVNSGARLLRVVRNDLADVVLVCEAKKKQTNYLRSLISDLAKGVYSVEQ